MKNIFTKLLTLNIESYEINSVKYNINGNIIYIKWSHYPITSNPEKDYPCFEPKLPDYSKSDSVLNFSIYYNGICYPIELTNEEKITVEYILTTKVKEYITNTKNKLNEEITKKILESSQPVTTNGGTSAESKE